MPGAWAPEQGGGPWHTRGISAMWSSGAGSLPARPWALGDSSLETQKKVPQGMLVFPLRSSCPAMGLAMSQALPGLFKTLTPTCGARTSPLPSSPSPSLP